MSENKDSKTEKPTPKKLRDARKKGQVAHSKDVVTLMSGIGVFGTLFLVSDIYMQLFQEMLIFPYAFIGAEFELALSSLTAALIRQFLYLVIPVMTVALVCALVANILQVGFTVSGHAITPNFSKLNPVEGFKRIFAIDSLIELAKSILKVAAIVGVVVWIQMRFFNDLTQMLNCQFSCITAIVEKMMMWLVGVVVGLFFCIAVLDSIHQRMKFIKNQMMTKDEVKREYKESEGDPRIKGKRRQLARELVEGGMLDQVKKSSVVVTNPTHLSVALGYDVEEGGLPRVNLRAKDYAAIRVRLMAQEYSIPVTENVPLAHSLFERSKEGAYIPTDLINPVAKVIRWALTIKQRSEDKGHS